MPQRNYYRNDPDRPVCDLDKLQAGLFYLTTQYSLHPCCTIAEKIVEHLHLLCTHPQIELVPEQNRLYARLINIWRSRLLVNMIPPSPTRH